MINGCGDIGKNTDEPVYGPYFAELGPNDVAVCIDHGNLSVSSKRGPYRRTIVKRISRISKLAMEHTLLLGSTIEIRGDGSPLRLESMKRPAARSLHSLLIEQNPSLGVQPSRVF